ncbi:MAG: hypothetical protein ACFCVK_01330 [Acidimicrobiales bacterium]
MTSIVGVARQTLRWWHPCASLRWPVSFARSGNSAPSATGTVAAVYEFSSTDDIGGLTAFSSATFDRSGVEGAFASAMGAKVLVALESAITDGYTDALLMPPTVWQQEHLAQLVAAFAAGDGWDAPFVEIGGLVPAGRPAAAYVLLLRPDPRSDDDLRGLTAPAVRKALGADACLTVNEYLVVQRLMFERFGDHRFDRSSHFAGGRSSIQQFIQPTPGQPPEHTGTTGLRSPANPARSATTATQPTLNHTFVMRRSGVRLPVRAR